MQAVKQNLFPTRA